MIEHETAQQDPGPYASTLTVARLVTENENLRRKLETQPVIEQAKGILMGYHGVSADDAFDLLRRWSQDSNTKLHQVARAVIAGRRPGDPLDCSMTHPTPATPRSRADIQDVEPSPMAVTVEPSPTAVTVDRL